MSTDASAGSPGARVPRVPGYGLIEIIGRGAYGEVWKAVHQTHGGVHAVKIVTFDPANPAARRNYERELNGLRSILSISVEQAALIRIWEVGGSEVDGRLHYSMEIADPDPVGNGAESASRDSHELGLFRPHTLRSELDRRGRLKPKDALELVGAILEALCLLHQHGRVHRDIKPANILYVGGRPKLADIGLVTLLSDAGSLVGTVGYVDSLKPGTVSGDLFSMGRVLAEMTSGRPAGDAGEFPSDIGQWETGEDLELFLEIREIVARACAGHLGERYASAESMLSDVRRVRRGESVRQARRFELLKRRFKRFAVATAALGMLVVGAFLWQRNQAIQLSRLIEQSRSLERQSRQHQIRLQMNRGVDAMNSGDLAGALPWLRQAMKLEEGDPGRESVHRERMAAIWRELPRLIAIGAHDGPIRHVTFSPDTRFVATASYDKTARVWDARSAEPITIPLVHDDEVLQVEFSPDGTQLASASSDGTVRIWGIDEFRIGRSSTAPAGRILRHGGAVEAIAWTGDGRWLISGSSHGEATVWDARSWQVRGVVHHENRVRALALSPDGRRLATGSEDGSARVWDLATLQPMTPWVRHTDGIRSVAFSPDGGWLATGSGDGTARIWDSATGAPASPELVHRGPVWHVCFSPDGRRLASCGGIFRRSGETWVWEVPGGRPLGEPFRQEKPVQQAVFSPDGRWLATASVDQTARLWDVATGNLVVPPIRHAASVWSVEFSPDGHRLLVGSRDGTWEIWDLVTPNAAQPTMWLSDRVADVSVSPSGRLVAAIAKDGSLEVRRSSDFELVKQVGFKRVANDTRVDFSPDEKFLVGGRFRGSRWLSIDGGKDIYAGLDGDNRVKVKFAPVGGAWVSGGRSRKAPGENWLWPGLGTKTAPIRLEAAFETTDIAFTPDGTRFALSTSIPHTHSVGEWGIWDSKDGHLVRFVTLTNSEPTSVEFNRDGTQLLVTFALPRELASSATIYDVKTGAQIGTPMFHDDGVIDGVWSRDGRWIATSGEDSKARIWDARTHQSLGKPLQHDRSVHSVAFSPDSTRLLTASRDFTARVWDISTGDPITPPLRHFGWVDKALYLLDGRRILTGSVDHSARIWDMGALDVPGPALDAWCLLTSGGSISPGGDWQLASASERVSAWKSLQGGLGSVLLAEATPDEQSRWHENAAARAEQVRDWAAVRFHIGRILDGTPAVASTPTSDPTATNTTALQSSRTPALETREHWQFRWDRAVAEWWHQKPETPPPTASVDGAALRRFYPVRGVETPARCVDLTRSYNAPLLNRWWLDVPEEQAFRLDRSLDGPGVERLRHANGHIWTYAGVPFDVRGLIQVWHTESPARDAHIWPGEITGIAANFRCTTLHFLIGELEFKRDEAISCGFILHYADGHSAECPVLFRRHVSVGSIKPPPLTESSLVWTGLIHAVEGEDANGCLYIRHFENPHPELRIESLDIRAGEGGPFVLGISYDPL